MPEMDRKLCAECGLPIVECNAAAIARERAEEWLVLNGYDAADARSRASALVPHSSAKLSLN